MQIKTTVRFPLTQMAGRQIASIYNFIDSVDQKYCVSTSLTSNEST